MSHDFALVDWSFEKKKRKKSCCIIIIYASTGYRLFNRNEKENFIYFKGAYNEVIA